MELVAFEARREQGAKMASYMLQLSAGIGVAAATGGAGLLPYLAGTGAFAGVGIALDPAIHADLKEGAWSGFANHASYHTPLIGTGHHAWDAWGEGNYLGAAGYTSLLGAELVGFRGAAGKVRWGGRHVLLTTPKLTLSDHAIQRMAQRGITPKMA